MILGIDLDGCAYPFVKNFLQYCKDSGIEVPEDYQPTHWNFYEDLGLNLDQFKGTIEAGIADRQMFVNDKHTHLDFPEPGFTSVMVKLRARGHHMHVVTHRNAKGAARQTLDWFERYGVPTDAVHFVRDKSVVRVDLMIEDSPGNFYDLVNSGIPTVLMDQPWNQNVNATRVNDWHDYLELVNSIESGKLIWHLNKFHTPKELNNYVGV